MARRKSDITGSGWRENNAQSYRRRGVALNSGSAAMKMKRRASKAKAAKRGGKYPRGGSHQRMRNGGRPWRAMKAAWRQRRDERLAK